MSQVEVLENQSGFSRRARPVFPLLVGFGDRSNARTLDCAEYRALNYLRNLFSVRVSVASILTWIARYRGNKRSTRKK
ncbi:hypothetical protein [Ruegeria arenilitoris]|uniref:hypothetical protein n=1 Tax=Ruegeria arenilitoris TaxID=1173585 RepID=UPI00148178FD|nr:hypothetical protein [Ruegeria arenilitoris]